MKREFLQEFRVGGEPLTKEVIDAIMAENGRDIQRVKAGFADYEDVKTELTRLQEAAAQAQNHQEAAAAWEEKYNQAMETHNRELAQLRFDHLLDRAITGAGGRSAKAIAALLDLETLKASENQQEAIEAALGELKKDSRYLFDTEVPPPYARFTGAWQAPQEKSPTTLAGALREKFERK